MRPDTQQFIHEVAEKVADRAYKAKEKASDRAQLTTLIAIIATGYFGKKKKKIQNKGRVVVGLILVSPEAVAVQVTTTSLFVLMFILSLHKLLDMMCWSELMYWFQSNLFTQ